MGYCKVTGQQVYSCDHYQCNEGSSEKKDPRSSQGMKYCHVAKKWVYGCDHFKCEN